jgi:sugar lactone lactonase YvrE
VKLLFRIFFLLIMAANLQAQDNDIYVVDVGPNREPPFQVLRFDAKGENPQVFINSELNRPQDIVFLEDSNTALVSNLPSNRITKYDATTGNYLGDFSVGRADGPTRMKIGADNLLYVLQWFGNGRVLRYQLDGTFVDEFTSVGVTQSIGLDWDSQGNLYVSSFDRSHVRKFDGDGNDLGLFISSSLLGPTNIWFEDNGDLLVLDWSGTSVKRFDSSGNFLGQFMQGLSQAEGIDTLSNGHFLIGNGGTSAVKQFDENGNFVKDFIPSGSGGLATPVAVVRRQSSGFEINSGLNDAWFDLSTAGQGFLITIFPQRKEMFLAWFTFDTQRPPEDVTAFLGEPGHRWLTAQGSYEEDTATLTIFVTEGGIFDAAEPVASTDPAGDGSMTVKFTDCEAGVVHYQIHSLDISGEIPIQRITPDNVALCEALGAR